MEALDDEKHHQYSPIRPLHREIILPGSSGSGWTRSTDPIDRMSPSPGQPESLSINLGCSD